MRPKLGIWQCLIPTPKTGWKTTITNGLSLWRAKMLRSLWQCLRAINQGHHFIDRLEERGVRKRKRLPTVSEKTSKLGILSMRLSLEQLQTQRFRHVWEMVSNPHLLSQAHGYHLELNCAILNRKEQDKRSHQQNTGHELNTDTYATFRQECFGQKTSTNFRPKEGKQPLKL